MSFTHQCGNGNTIPIQTASSSAGSGSSDPLVPHMGAQKINLSIMDVQQTIQEGRASGKTKPFNISGSTLMK